MKKLAAFLLCILLLLPLGMVSAQAQSLTEQAGVEAGADRLEEGLRDQEQAVGGTLTLDGTYDAPGALSRLWRYACRRLADEVRGQFRFTVSLTVLVFFCALADGLTDRQSARDGIALAACCAAAAWVAGDWDSGIAQATETLNRLSDYSRAALPVVYTAAAAAGAAGSAPLRYAACCLALEVLMTVSRQLILPLIYAYLALALCGCVAESSLLRALQRVIQWVAVTLLAGMTTAFCLYIGLTGLVAGSADAVAVKAARSVIAGVLPVVGGILSDSASALLAAAGVIRNTAGVFSLIAVCALCTGPFLFLALKMLLLRAVSVLAELLPGGKLSRLLEQCSTVFGLLLGLVGSSGAMLFFSLMAGMKAVSGT